jgi:uncharacterized protein (DUF433 family)
MNNSAWSDFRDTHLGRLTYIQGTRVPVYLASMTAADLGNDPQKLAEHYGWPLAKAETVLTYSAAFKDEVERNIADHSDLGEFDALKQMLPTLQRTQIGS